MQTLAMEKSLMQTAFLHIGLRGMLSASVRLGLVGPYRGQQIQTQLLFTIGEVLSSCKNLGLHDVAQTAPLLDLFQNNQDRLYSRLFQS